MGKRLLFSLLLFFVLVLPSVFSLTPEQQETVLNNLLQAKIELETYKENYKTVTQKLSDLEVLSQKRGKTIVSLNENIGDLKKTIKNYKKLIEQKEKHVENLKRLLQQDTETLAKLKNSLQKASDSYNRLEKSRNVWRAIGIGGIVITVAGGATIALIVGLDL